MLSPEILKNYKNKKSPMNPLGEFVYLRTYSRFLDDEARRETWGETAKRAAEYNCGLAPVEDGELEALYDNMFNVRQFLSGRTNWVGQTPVSYKYPIANFNCAFMVVDEIVKFSEMFYLCMVGTGVGIRVLLSDVAKLPKVRTDVDINHVQYTPLPKSQRKEHTELTFIDDMAVIDIGDSKEAWVTSVDYFFELLTSHKYRNIKSISIIYNSIRKKGDRLKTFGGTASGHESIKAMFTNFDKILKGTMNSSYPQIEVDAAGKGRLRPIHVFDIICSIGQNVVVGGVRRTAISTLIDQNDKEMIFAKTGIMNHPELYFRFMSNNSIYYYEKPSYEQIEWQMKVLKEEGEPCFLNAEAASKRRENFAGVNPCFEILLADRGLCNLTTINVFAFVTEDGKLDLEGLLKAQRLSARAGYRMTCVTLELHKWDIVQNRDRLIGTSLTGWADMLDKTGMTKEQEIELLELLRATSRKAADEYADSLGLPRTLLATTVKPEGTLSQLAGVSSGVHDAHSRYFIRRVRINAHDPLAKLAIARGFKIVPELGQTWENATTLVIEFPCKSESKRTKSDVTAIEQLERYRMFQNHYTEHNTSNTITFKESELPGIVDWLYNNWDDMIGVSFLKLDDHAYDLAPYETITEEEYLKRLAEQPTLNAKEELHNFEKVETEIDLGDAECSTGACPVR